MNFKIESGKGVELILVPESFEGLNVCDETLGYLKDSFSPKLGNILTILGPGKSERIFVGIGKEENLDHLRRAIYAGTKKVIEIKKDMVFKLAKVASFAKEDVLKVLVEGALQATYKFDKYLKKDEDERETTVFIEGAEGLENIVSEYKNVLEGVFVTRDLVNTPANDMYPEVLANFAKEDLGNLGVNVKVLGKSEIEALNMEAFLQVARGSEKEPKFIIMEYLPVADEKPIMLVGKGLTYDAGGYAIKPAGSMASMKSDMGGSAAVIGAIHAIAKNKIKKNVVGIVAACENLISGNAYKNGDIIGSMKGLTIEVGNTDAEGRLTLADALYYAATKYDGKVIVDLATLTGACIVGLGMYTTGSVSNCDENYGKIADAFEKSGELVWRWPTFEVHRESVKGTISDLLNTVPGGGGSITAGLFLENFVEERPWVHLDIAGPAFGDSQKGYLPKGATGVPVKSLYEFVKNY